MAKIEELKLLINAQDRASSVLNKVKGAVLGVAGAYLGMQGVKYIITDIIGAAIESEKVWNDVSASLKRHNFQVETSMESVHKFSSELQNLTGISDEVAGQSIQMLLDYNNDLATSFDLVTVAADLAAGGHMDMKAAVDLVGKASVGYTGTLSRYGIIIDQAIPTSERFQKALEQINSRFGGAAAARMETTAGKIDRMKQSWADLREIIGSVLLPTLSDLFDVLNEIFVKLSSDKKSVAFFEMLKDELSYIPLYVDQAIANIRILFLTFDKYELYATKLSAAATHAWKAITFQFSDASEASVIMDIVNKQIQQVDHEINRIDLELSEKGIKFLEGIETKHKAVSNSVYNITKDIIEQNKEMRTVLLDINQEFLDREEEQLLEFFQSQSDDDTEASMERLAKLQNELTESTNIIKAQNKAVKDAETQVMNDMLSIANSTLDSTLRMFMSGKGRIKDIWISMAQDFTIYFAKQILKDIAKVLLPKLLSLLKIFDVRENDMMAMKVGQDYGYYLSQGIISGIQSSNLGQSISLKVPQTYFPRGNYQPTSQGRTTNYNFYGPVTDPEYVKRNIIPEIEEEAEFGLSRIKVNDFNITGKPNGAIY